MPRKLKWRIEMDKENMISQKLRTLLAEKNMRASNLDKETGIEQSTLSMITSGKSKSIQFDTRENSKNKQQRSHEWKGEQVGNSTKLIRKLYHECREK